MDIKSSFAHTAAGAVVAILLLHALSTPWAAQPAEALCGDPPAISEKALPDGRKAVKAVFYINADPNLVYETLKDASRFPEFMPDTTEARIIESGPGYHVAHFMGGNGFMKSTFTMKRFFEDRERRITWTQIEGRTREVEGSWAVEAHNGGAMITYMNFADAGALVPAAMVRAYLKEGIPPMAANLRLRVLSGGTWQSENYIRK